MELKIVSWKAICLQHTILMFFAGKLYIFLRRGFWGVLQPFIKFSGVFFAPNGPSFKLMTFLYDNSFSFINGTSTKVPIVIYILVDILNITNDTIIYASEAVVVWH